MGGREAQHWQDGVSQCPFRGAKLGSCGVAPVQVNRQQLHLQHSCTFNPQICALEAVIWRQLSAAEMHRQCTDRADYRAKPHAAAKTHFNYLHTCSAAPWASAISACWSCTLSSSCWQFACLQEGFGSSSSTSDS